MPASECIIKDYNQCGQMPSSGQYYSTISYDYGTMDVSTYRL